MRTTTPVTIQRHVLPGEERGDTAWFQRQNPFEQQEIYRQVAFKRRCWPNLSDGTSSKHPTHTYPHILPAGHGRLAFYEPLADDILSYLVANDISPHSELLNLKSSQAACLNILFPLCQDLDLAQVVLRPLLPGLREVTAIEFEYTGPEGATQWLGEPSGGKRGQNRTSIDAAFFWIGSDNTVAVPAVQATPGKDVSLPVDAVRPLLVAPEGRYPSLVGYVDTSYDNDLAAMLDALTGRCTRKRISDGALLRSRMQWGDRTAAYICARDDQVLPVGGSKYYDRVCFVYLKMAADRPPARLDVTRWLLEAGEPERTADVVAVITVQDRERFYRVFQEFAEKEGLPLRFSRKVVSKRWRRS